MKHALFVLPGQLRKYGSSKSYMPFQFLFLSKALSEVGIPSQILDQRIETSVNVDLKDVLFVGISTYSDGTMIAPALEFAKKVRDANPAIPIIWGGVHPSLLPEQTLKNPYVDIVVIGEAEKTIKELALAIKEGIELSDLMHIKGIGYKKDGEIHINPSHDFIDMNTLPIDLPYDSLKMDRYITDPFPMHTSRGCPFRCGFCYNPTFNKLNWRAKNSETVLNEIEHIMRKFGATKFSFSYEDEFFIDRKRVEEICEGLLSRGIKITWGSFCRLESFAGFKDDFLKLLERAGCTELYFGAESGSQKILDYIKKGITVEDIICATEKIAKTNMKQVVSFMCGFPTEDLDDKFKTFDLIDELARINPDIWIPGINYFTPFPSTQLSETVSKNFNYVPPASLEEWSKFRDHQKMGNITWNSAESVRMMQGLNTMSYFPFYTDNYKVPEHLRIPFGPILKLLHSIARFRWKHRFFKFPIEWKLFNKGKEFLKGGNF